MAMKYKIVTHPNTVLRKKSGILSQAEIIKFKKSIPEFVNIMLEKDGIGLAAPQVGVSKRFLAINKNVHGGDEHLVLFNPRITFQSKKTTVMEEGCLSVPDVFANVARSEKVRVKALDINGNKIDFKAKGMLARVLQHEVDHLNGILFIDKIEK